MGMDYLLSLCKPSIIDEYKNQDDFYNYFQDKNWFGPKIAPVKGAEYDFVEHHVPVLLLKPLIEWGFPSLLYGGAQCRAIMKKLMV